MNDGNPKNREPLDPPQGGGAAESGEFEERSRKVFSAERKEDIWVLIISAITVILGLTGVITKDTFTSLFF